MVRPEVIDGAQVGVYTGVNCPGVSLFSGYGATYVFYLQYSAAWARTGASVMVSKRGTTERSALVLAWFFS
jgi:hypothetical protein